MFASLLIIPCNNFDLRPKLLAFYYIWFKACDLPTITFPAPVHSVLSPPTCQSDVHPPPLVAVPLLSPAHLGTLHPLSKSSPGTAISRPSLTSSTRTHPSPTWPLTTTCLHLPPHHSLHPHPTRQPPRLHSSPPSSPASRPRTPRSPGSSSSCPTTWSFSA